MVDGELQVRPETVPTFFSHYLGEQPFDGEWWATGDHVREGRGRLPLVRGPRRRHHHHRRLPGRALRGRVRARLASRGRRGRGGSGAGRRARLGRPRDRRARRRRALRRARGRASGAREAASRRPTSTRGSSSSRRSCRRRRAARSGGPSSDESRLARGVGELRGPLHRHQPRAPRRGRDARRSPPLRQGQPERLRPGGRDRHRRLRLHRDRLPADRRQHRRPPRPQADRDRGGAARGDGGLPLLRSSGDPGSDRRPLLPRRRRGDGVHRGLGLERRHGAGGDPRADDRPLRPGDLDRPHPGAPDRRAAPARGRLSPRLGVRRRRPAARRRDRLPTAGELRGRARTSTAGPSSPARRSAQAGPSPSASSASPPSPPSSSSAWTSAASDMARRSSASSPRRWWRRGSSPAGSPTGSAPPAALWARR